MSAVWRSGDCEPAVIGDLGGWAVGLEGEVAEFLHLAGLSAAAEDEQTGY